MKVKDLINQLQEMCDPDYEVIPILWNEDDVNEKAKELGIELSPNSINLVIEHLTNEHDCNYGISWETIELAIKRYA